jgi:hypothetical protein
MRLYTILYRETVKAAKRDIRAGLRINKLRWLNSPACFDPHLGHQRIFFIQTAGDQRE